MHHPGKVRAEADEFSMVDIFTINTLIHTGEVTEKAKEAWARVRSKLIVSAEIYPPKLLIGDGASVIRTPRKEGRPRKGDKRKTTSVRSIRLDDQAWEEVDAWAEEDGRSVNWVLEDAILNALDGRKEPPHER